MAIFADPFDSDGAVAVHGSAFLIVGDDAAHQRHDCAC
jgi:hypothetical protein